VSLFIIYAVDSERLTEWFNLIFLSDPSTQLNQFLIVKILTKKSLFIVGTRVILLYYINVIHATGTLKMEIIDVSLNVIIDES